MVEPHNSNFRVITTNSLGVRIFRKLRYIFFETFCLFLFQSCSYYLSNAVPLKLVFKNVNEKAGPVYAMFKAGDDLRQDMMTMQIIRMMDRLWLKEGLDLKMITFSCLPTGPKRGTFVISFKFNSISWQNIIAMFEDPAVFGPCPPRLENRSAAWCFCCRATRAWCQKFSAGLELAV